LPNPPTVGIIDSAEGLQRPREEGWAQKKAFVTVRGLGLMLVYCAISGFAGVYTEVVLKSQPTQSYFVQGLKLYAFGVAVSLLQAWRAGALRIPSGLDTSGFSSWTWAIILTQALNGLIYGAVMKVGQGERTATSVAAQSSLHSSPAT
jgi:hypothetical protein